MTVSGQTDAHVTMVDDDRPVMTVTKTDASATIGTMATVGDRTEAEADKTPTKTTTGTAQRATIPTLHGAPCATGVKPPARAVAKAPVTNHDSTTAPSGAVTAETGEGNNATANRVRSTTTTGIVLNATIPISPSDNRATDAMHLAQEVAPTTVARKATATAEGTTETEGTGPMEGDATTVEAVAPMEVSDAAVTGHPVADETIAAVVALTGVSNATEAGRTVLVAMNDRIATAVIDATEATAVNKTVIGGAAIGAHSINARKVRVTAKHEASVRATRTTVSQGTSETDRVGSLEAMMIDQRAAA